MQIVHGEEEAENLTSSVTREVSIPAARGNIYDRYGRPLATNEAAFSVEIDDSITVDFENSDAEAASLYNKLVKNGYMVGDILPISSSEPYEFTISGNELEDWKSSAGLSGRQMGYNAGETLEYLYGRFGLLDSDMSDEEKRSLISLALGSSDRNIMLMNLIITIETSGGEIVDELPISENQPYYFLIDDEDEINEWKISVTMSGEELEYDAEESMDYLIELFGIPENISASMQRKLASVRYALYLQRYRKYQPVTVARDISDRVIAAVEENLDKFPGVSVETESMRIYDEGKIFSNIIGYIGSISDQELQDYAQYGYDGGDIVGKTGIEKVMEIELNGQDGKMMVEVDNMGRKISTLETEAPVSGQDVFLTIDKELQIAAYNYLKESLADAIITRLTSEEEKDVPVTIKQLFISMIDSNNISVSSIMEAEEGYQTQLKNIILQYDEDIDVTDPDQRTAAKQALSNAVDSGSVSYTTLIYVLMEQGVITDVDDNYRARILTGELTPLQVIIDRLEAGDLEPAETGLEPCTGSVVVSDVNSGEVLALVTYPAYDNNEL